MIYSGEINYEKKYKEALEKAKKTLEKSSAKDVAKLVVEYFFPELAESEDEMIRKEIIEYLWDISNQTPLVKESLDCRRWIAWLEKQKEQKPHYTKRNALFDKCVENCDPEVMKEVSDNIDEMLQKEQHPSSKFHPGDWAVYDGPLGHAILQIKDVVDGRYTFVDNDSTLFEEDSDKFLRPLTQKDVEKPAEWSKKDEAFLKVAIAVCNRYSHKDTADWLKSLRPSWKPSKEQMEVLLSTQDMVRSSGYRQNAKVLASLYEHLKKLM